VIIFFRLSPPAAEATGVSNLSLAFPMIGFGNEGFG